MAARLEDEEETAGALARVSTVWDVPADDVSDMDYTKLVFKFIDGIGHCLMPR